MIEDSPLLSNVDSKQEPKVIVDQGSTMYKLAVAERTNDFADGKDEVVAAVKVEEIKSKDTVVNDP